VDVGVKVESQGECAREAREGWKAENAKPYELGGRSSAITKGLKSELECLELSVCFRLLIINLDFSPHNVLIPPHNLNTTLMATLSVCDEG
jgi:hypothetical protein